MVTLTNNYKNILTFHNKLLLYKNKLSLIKYLIDKYIKLFYNKVKEVFDESERRFAYFEDI